MKLFLQARSPEQCSEWEGRSLGLAWGDKRGEHPHEEHHRQAQEGEAGPAAQDEGGGETSCIAEFYVSPEALNNFISEWEPWKAYVRAGGEHLRHVHRDHQDLHPGLLRRLLREYLGDIERRTNIKTLLHRMGMMMMVSRVPWLSTPARTTTKTTSPLSTLAAATASLRSLAPLWRPTRPQWRVAEAAASLASLPAASQSINCVLWDILSLTNPLYSCVLSFGFKIWSSVD